VTAEDVETAAALLDGARRSGVWLDDLPPALTPHSIDDAYRVQAAVTRRCARVAAGWKIGATSLATQVLLGTPDPIFGRMFADTIVRAPAIVRGQRPDVLIVEAEFAFTMQATLPARTAPYAPAEVVAAIGTMVPALEYIGSVFVRRAGRPIADILVDDAGHGGLVLGSATTDWSVAALPAHPVRLEMDGRTIATGDGSAVLGNPITCLVWLANALSARGIDLAAGEIVTTGTCTGAQVVVHDVDIVGDFGIYGNVAMRFDADHGVSTVTD
jgi:2-keto-4-pentenoate hydratase